MMDISSFAAPRSDQLNADDLIAGPRTVTITRVDVPGGEQPVHIHLHGLDGRPWKPSKMMLRVLMLAWGADSDDWIFKRLTLYRDPEVRFGGKAVGGIRISHMEGLDHPRTWSLTTARGKKGAFTVQPLADVVPAESDVQACTDPSTLRLWWEEHPGLREAIEARAQALKAAGGGAS